MSILWSPLTNWTPEVFYLQLKILGTQFINAGQDPGSYNILNSKKYKNPAIPGMDKSNFK